MPSNNRVGVLVTVLALISLSQLLYFTFDNRQRVECQTSVNQAFLQTIKQRSEISDGDREAIRTLIGDLTNQNNDKKALEDYYERDRQLQALRDSFSYPEIGQC